MDITSSVRKTFQGNVWILIEPAPDLPGTWVAHCLDFDVITQGSSLHHAFEMAQEAIEMTVLGDLAAGRDPRERRAPDEYWKRLWRIVERADRRPSRGPLLPKDESGVAAFAAEMVFASKKRRTGKRSAPRVPKVPVALALSGQRAA
jgi:predicted RNase H-like HicB family nuclease